MDIRWSRAVRRALPGDAKRFTWEQYVLERDHGKSLQADQWSLLWITLHVPAGAKPETYRGDLRLDAAGESASVPLTVRVLPFRLPEPGIEMGAFLYHPSFDDALLEKHLIDLREHGINTVLPTLRAQVIYTQGKSRDLPWGTEDRAATLFHGKRTMDAIRRVWGGWFFRPVVEFGEQIIFYWDDVKDWYTFWPHCERRNGYLLGALSAIEQQARQERWPPLRVYPLDEAGAHRLLDEAVHYYSLLKRQRPDLETWTTIGGGTALGFDEIGHLGPYVDFFSTNRFTPEIARRLRERGKPFGLYNGSGGTPAGARFFYGFFGWKSGASQIAQWVYHFGNSAFDASGVHESNEGFVLNGSDGPLPSVVWESIREGIRDFRYLQLLRRLQHAALASADSETRCLGEDARRTLNGILAQIDWGFMGLNRNERSAPPTLATLDHWRGQLVGHILKLSTTVQDDTRRSAPERDPLQFPWKSQ